MTLKILNEGLSRIDGRKYALLLRLVVILLQKIYYFSSKYLYLVCYYTIICINYFYFYFTQAESYGFRSFNWRDFFMFSNAK